MTEAAVAVVAAALTASASVIVFIARAIHSDRQKTKLRRREAFADAFKLLAAYKEFPYITRRRRISDPEGERIRISTDMSRVQQEISFFSVWIAAENRRVAEAYNRLVTETRRIAGMQVREAWKLTPVSKDEEMNMPDLGLGKLREYEDAYLRAVVLALHPILARLKAAGRFAARIVRLVVRWVAGGGGGD